MTPRVSPLPPEARSSESPYGAEEDPGLSTDEALRRLARDGPNVLPAPAGPSAWRHLLRQLIHFFALMLWVAAGLALLAGMPQLAVAIVVVVVNGVFAFTQEHRAERASQALRDLLPRRAVVRRDGNRQEIDASELVVVAAATRSGDRICADAAERRTPDRRLVSPACPGWAIGPGLAVRSALLSVACKAHSWSMTGIVVGVDGSEGSAHALAWAAQEAAVQRLPLTAVLAWDSQEAGDTTARSEGAALAMLDHYVIDAVGAAKASSVRRRTDDHRASRALLDASLGASLLVLGPRGLGSFRGSLLGSVSERCVHYAACPVAIVHRTDAVASRMERIVVGVDGSEGAQSALAWAAREARLHGALLEAVHAWTLPYGLGFPYASANFDPTWIEESAQATLDAAVGGIDTDGLAHPVEGILVNGGATPAILERAKGADLIVVGSRGVGGFAGLLLGSVSHQVVHHATTPVVVVPRKA